MPRLQIKDKKSIPKKHTLADLKKLESGISINFKDRQILKNAFIHRSYLNENKQYEGDSNERLEFLGDAVLSTVVSRFLYETRKESPEGELTKLRAALVRTETLAKIARQLFLGDYLYLSRGEEETGGRSNDSTLANTLEALIGAIYLDQGLDKSEEFIEKIILKNWQVLIESAISDHKSRLQEIMQKKYKVSPTYKLISSWGPDHARKFQIGVYMNDKLLSKGLGKNKQQAAQDAAKSAIKVLD